jgi:hypothetical protein
MGDAAGEAPEDEHFKGLHGKVCPWGSVHRTPLSVNRQLAPQAQHPVGAATAELFQGTQESSHIPLHLGSRERF